MSLVPCRPFTLKKKSNYVQLPQIWISFPFHPLLIQVKSYLEFFPLGISPSQSSDLKITFKWDYNAALIYTQVHLTIKAIYLSNLLSLSSDFLMELSTFYIKDIGVIMVDGMCTTYLWGRYMLLCPLISLFGRCIQMSIFILGWTTTGLVQLSDFIIIITKSSTQWKFCL